MYSVANIASRSVLAAASRSSRLLSRQCDHATPAVSASSSNIMESSRALSAGAAHDARSVQHNYETPCSPKVDAVFEKILELDMVEVHIVTELLAEKLGMNINAAALGAGAGGGGKNAGAEGSDETAAAAEKTSFDLKLVGFDAKAKIKVIKEVRTMASLGLKEAKDLVEGVPKTVMTGIKKDEAEELKAKLEGLGATVEIV